MKSRTQRLSEALMICGLLLLLTVLALPAFQSVRPRRRPPCRNNLKQIVLALHNYHDVHGCFPPAYFADEYGRPIHSWRVMLLPQLGEEEIYAQYRFDEPWNGPNNRKLHDRMPKYIYDHGVIRDTMVGIFQCPNEKGRSKTDKSTSYVAIVGPNTAFPGSESVSIDDISDGTSNTLLIVEVKKSEIHWMEPRDLYVQQMANTVNPQSGQGISSAHEGGALILFGDGAVRFLSEETTSDTIRRLIQINDGEELGDF